MWIISSKSKKKNMREKGLSQILDTIDHALEGEPRKVTLWEVGKSSCRTVDGQRKYAGGKQLEYNIQIPKISACIYICTSQRMPRQARVV